MDPSVKNKERKLKFVSSFLIMIVVYQIAAYEYIFLYIYIICIFCICVIGKMEVLCYTSQLMAEFVYVFLHA